MTECEQVREDVAVIVTHLQYLKKVRRELLQNLTADMDFNFALKKLKRLERLALKGVRSKGKWKRLKNTA